MSELDPQSLLYTLKKIEKETSVPFLERKSQQQGYREDPLEELSEVVLELSEREKQITRCFRSRTTCWTPTLFVPVERATI